MLDLVVGAVVVIFPIAVVAFVGLNAMRQVGSLFGGTDT